MTENTMIIQRIPSEIHLIDKSLYDAVVLDNNTLRNHLLELQGTAATIRILQDKNDLYVKDIETLKKENSELKQKITDLENHIYKQNDKIDFLTKSFYDQNNKIDNLTKDNNNFIKSNYDRDLIIKNLQDSINTSGINNSQIKLNNKLVIAFQDINAKYALEQLEDNLVNSLDFTDQMFDLRKSRNENSHFISANNGKLDDNSDVVHYKIKLVQDKLTILTDEEIISFENLYGKGFIKEMLSQINKILYNYKYTSSISEKIKNRYSNFFKDLD
jgi:cell division protein FtsB